MTLKRIGFLTLLIVMLVPVSAFAEIVESPKPYDYRNGLLDDDYIILENDFPVNSYDNDLSTRITLTSSSRGNVVFKHPVHIKSMFLKSQRITTTYDTILTIRFLNGDVKSISFNVWQINVNDYIEMNYDNVIEINYSSSGYNKYLYEIDFFGSYDKNEVIIIKPLDIENVKQSVTPSSATFIYDLPNDDNFSHVEIHADGKIYETTKDTFTLNNLKPETSYDVTFYSVDKDGNKSDGVTVTVKTDKEPEKPKEVEVKNVKAKAEHNRVDLSWQLPDADEFEFVTIYRKTLDNKTSSIFDLITPKKAYASDGYDPIFETNGTYFNDLTVDAATTYEYKLTSKHDGVESPGVTVQATTAPPIISGGGAKEQENGDYLLSWTEPKKGEVNIIVGGKVYATVPASDKSFTVPANDVKYNIFGDPDVGLQAVAPNGTPGDIDTGGIGLDGSSLPFTVKNLIQSGNNLFLIVSSFLLLGLSFIIVPKIIKLIRESAGQATPSYSPGGRGFRAEREVRSGREPRLTDRQRKGLMRHGL